MNNIKISKIFKDDKIPFVEARYVINSATHYTEHLHNTLSIGVIEDGQVSFTYDNKNFLLKPHDLVIINPNILHSCNPIQNEARTYHMLYFDIDWCRGIQENIFGKVDKFINFDDVVISDNKLFQSLIKLNFLLLDLDISYLEKEELIYEFLFNLFSKYTSSKLIKNNKYEQYNEVITKSKEYMHQNLNLNITIKDISDYLNISQFYFIKIFKLHTKTTPYKYMLNYKIIKAKKLLEKDFTLSQIAFDLGFSDQSHFNKVFKNYVACTPNEYKQSMTIDITV